MAKNIDVSAKPSTRHAYISTQTRVECILKLHKPRGLSHRAAASRETQHCLTMLIKNEWGDSLGAFVGNARSPKGGQKQNFLLVPLEDSRGE